MLPGLRSPEDLSASGWGALVLGSSQRGPPLMAWTHFLQMTQGRERSPLCFGSWLSGGGDCTRAWRRGRLGGWLWWAKTYGHQIQPYEHLRARSQWS